MAYIITVGDIVESLHFTRNVAMVSRLEHCHGATVTIKTMTSLQSASGVGIFSIFLLIVVANIHFWRDLMNFIPRPK